VACVEALSGVLCTDASKVGPEEVCRVSDVLCLLLSAGDARVGAVYFYGPAQGDLFVTRPVHASGNVLGRIVAEPTLSRKDAIVLAHTVAVLMQPWHNSFKYFHGPATTGVSQFELFRAVMLQNPITNHGSVAACSTMLELLREPRGAGCALQSEFAVAGAWGFMAFMFILKPETADPFVDGDLYDLVLTELRTGTPMDWLCKSRKRSGLFSALIMAVNMSATYYHPIEAATVPTVRLLESGLLGALVQVFKAFELIGPSEDTPPPVIFFNCWLMCALDHDNAQCRELVRSLATAFRFILELEVPLPIIEEVGWNTRMAVLPLIAKIYGRDEAGGMFSFSQADADIFVDVLGELFAAKNAGKGHGLNPKWNSQCILNLSISDANKLHLMANRDFVPFLLESIRLAPEHHRNTDGTSDRLKGVCQRDFAECLEQLALHGPSRELLLRDPDVVVALGELAERGYSDLAKRQARAALAVLHDRTPAAAPAREGDSAMHHVMISYNWDHQPVIKRINAGLKLRGYNVWIDVEQMKGSTIDAMSEAIDNAAVFLCGVSLAYKESANCRL
jgi:hypothetical protein